MFASVYLALVLRCRAEQWKFYKLTHFVRQLRIQGRYIRANTLYIFCLDPILKVRHNIETSEALQLRPFHFRRTLYRTLFVARDYFNENIINKFCLNSKLKALNINEIFKVLQLPSLTFMLNGVITTKNSYVQNWSKLKIKSARKSQNKILKI